MDSWEQWKKAKATAIEYLAVFIASAGFMFSVLAAILAATAIWIAYDANENAKIAQIELNNHMECHHDGTCL